MKFSRNVILSFSFIFLLHTNLFGHENPWVVLKTPADKSLLVVGAKHKLLQIPVNRGSLKVSPFLKLKSVKQVNAARILSWDMKFKFRLSHNLNIIFSYN
jgi:hypothetical protein